MSIDDATPEEWDALKRSRSGEFYRSALDKQEGGSHYKDMAIQPIEFIMANNLNYCEANIVKYACRHAAKGGAEDVRKIIHYAELLLEVQYGQE
jgi:hypothetical protein